MTVPDDMEQIPAYDPANPMFGPTDVGLTWGMEATTDGPVLFMGFRTSNCTFTVPFTEPAELQEMIRQAEFMLKKFKGAATRAQFELPPVMQGSGLFVPSHITGASMPIPDAVATGLSEPFPPRKIRDNPQA